MLRNIMISRDTGIYARAIKEHEIHLNTQIQQKHWACIFDLPATITPWLCTLMPV